MWFTFLLRCGALRPKHVTSPPLRRSQRPHHHRHAHYSPPTPSPSLSALSTFAITIYAETFHQWIFRTPGLWNRETLDAPTLMRACYASNSLISDSVLPHRKVVGNWQRQSTSNPKPSNFFSHVTKALDAHHGNLDHSRTLPSLHFVSSCSINYLHNFARELQTFERRNSPVKLVDNNLQILCTIQDTKDKTSSELEFCWNETGMLAVLGLLPFSKEKCTRV